MMTHHTDTLLTHAHLFTIRDDGAGDIVSNLVFAASGSEIKAVMIAGRAPVSDPSCGDA
jgi:cytosine/adenosine deaminase-related metal-dependent hydrolase